MQNLELPMGRHRVKSERIREIKPDDLDFTHDETTVREFDMNPADRRRYQRAALEVPISLRLLDARGEVLCSGRGVLRDLSLDGAFITAIEINEATAKLDHDLNYKLIVFEILEGPFKGVEAKAHPVRVGPLASGIGVKLDAGFSLSL